jgi:hypothetical protein
VIVETVEETVTVPAGTFSNCVRTKTLGKTTTKDVENFAIIRGTAVEVSLEQQAWFCPSVGLVKTVRKEGSNHLGMGSAQMSTDLSAFKR